VKSLLELEPNVCARQNEDCSGRITWEHALIYAGKQIDEVWAIIHLCAYHHEVDEFQDGGGLDKEINVWIALNRATTDELLQYSKAIDYQRMRTRLNNKYGNPKIKTT
jgi:hypothetical protein